MRLVPNIQNFVNDKMTVNVTNEWSIILTIVQESFEYDSRVTKLDEILIESFAEIDGVLYRKPLPSIIGMGNALIEIVELDATVLGHRVSVDNLGKWRLQINE